MSKPQYIIITDHAVSGTRERKLVQIWTMGGRTEPMTREQFDTFISELMQIGREVF